MGFNISVSYKNFDLSTFLFWNQGNQIYNASRYWVDFNTYATNKSARMLYESWTPELGDKAKLPRLSSKDADSFTNPNSYFVEDDSYLRMKNLQLGYTFPTAWLSKLKVSKLRIYVQSQNLFTITSKSFSGLDPDAAGSGTELALGVSDNVTPTPKKILFGLSLGF